ncbi:unnamed protein product [Durusdinium trenchii]|uniref:Zinc ribbon domain-containing protein n=1 Tax=Durusdinium trenchii TaxID=1381693 RepID=A0ABP0JZ17_9DINO
MASPSFANSFAQGNVSLQSWASGVSQFEQVAAPLASELLATLEQEHTREVVTLYEEQVQLREELRRVVDLMEQEVLPRERQLHNMFEQLNAAFHSSAENMRRQHEEFHTMASQVAQKHDNSRRQMLDPLEEAEQELARIKKALKQPLVVSDLPLQQIQPVQSEQPVQSVPTQSAKPLQAPTQRLRRVADVCPKCGNVYSGDSLYCRRCGQKREGIEKPLVGTRPPGSAAGAQTNRTCR